MLNVKSWRPCKVLFLRWQEQPRLTLNIQHLTLKKNSLLLLLEFFDSSLEGCDLLYRVAFFLALKSYHLLRSVSHEVLVAELLTHTHQEAFKVLELCLSLLYLGSHVDKVAQWYGKLVGTYHETGCVGALLGDDLYFVEVGHLQSYVVVSLEVVLAHSLE